MGVLVEGGAFIGCFTVFIYMHGYEKIASLPMSDFLKLSACHHCSGLTILKLSVAHLFYLWVTTTVFRVVCFNCPISDKGFLSDLEKMVYWLNYRAKCPEVVDFYYFDIIPMR